MAGGSYLGPGPALLALLPWFSFRTLTGEEGKENDEKCGTMEAGPCSIRALALEADSLGSKLILHSLLVGVSWSRT